MWKHSGSQKEFADDMCQRLQAEIETERWQILLKQKPVIDEYSRIIARLKDLDRQLMRLSGPTPPRVTSVLNAITVTTLPSP